MKTAIAEIFFYAFELYNTNKSIKKIKAKNK